MGPASAAHTRRGAGGLLRSWGPSWPPTRFYSVGLSDWIMRGLSRRPVPPARVAAEQRHGRDRHLGARLLDLPRIGDVDQRVVLAVVDPPHGDRLEDQALTGAEDLLAVPAQIDVADDDRPGLPAGDGGI